ncbi:MAG: quinone-dependent dihydroorotate dehydrogenase [Candidatus Levybacteria bacterium]|nr:quinone-dependent dihydroorotate dehydrogenase [Candidatus Levybacteria bacterium]
MLIPLYSFFYRNALRRIFFQFDPELVHNLIVKIGETQGKINLSKHFLRSALVHDSPVLKQKIAGIEFKNPMGLAAGFDYNAQLTQILPSLDFGFETIGTITNLPYAGNPRPILGRLPKSKSLMVNKGFKNKGVVIISQKLKGQTFQIPLGISIGMTNPGKTLSKAKSASGGQKSAIQDILQAFRIFENSNIKSSYYELNISCPNLYGNVTFYPPKNLDELLTAVDDLKLNKPVFIKMPINETDHQTLKMLDVIVRHKIAGVIFGNLQKDRNDPSLDPEEVKKWKVGNFSGKPTEKRSNELIALAYKKYGSKLVIIGCGGIFNAQDAYRKIKLGASLLQLITGLIYEGPLLVAKINNELPKLLKQDGFTNIKDAIGVELQ